MKIFRLIGVISALLVLGTSAWAQTVPSSAEPSRIGGQIAPMAPAPSISGAAAVSGPGAVSAPDGADKITLKLQKLIIEDMTAYKLSDIEPLYKDSIGKTVTLADVFSIAAAITAKYRNDGYILTQVILPPQTIDGGVVRMRVVEGYADRVIIEGATRGSKAYIQEFADKIKAAKPLNASTLERYMLLLNDLPGISARAVLAPAKTPGASDITIVVDQKPYSLFFQTDNRGSRYIGPLQVTAGTQVNNIFGLYEALSLQLAAAPEGWPHSEMRFGSLTWQQPVGIEGTRLDLNGGISATHPGFTLAPFDVNGIAHTASLRVQHPFLRARTLSFTANAKLDYLNSARDDNLGLPATKDRVRGLRIGGALQAADRFSGVNSLTAEFSKGLNILGASRKGDANVSRAQGDPQFVKATAEASRLQRIHGPFSLLVSAAGQKSANTLLASEEFGVGGMSFGSAYDNSEITGEDGVAVRAELRADNLFRTPASLLQLYGFYDFGQVWDRDNAVVKDRIRSLASAGAGLRATLHPNVTASFEAAKPLTRPVQTAGDNDARFFGTLTIRY
ncbi:MAG: ShlB/FhaC/HecB family hemolysin secretion/activation protein [Alphaproteobacteria bacterium]|nr:MAG: ShlB/FhaC/HecB family hemolysin secretion/activation protein [Alphaproteobacteria bacterium]